MTDGAVPVMRPRLPDATAVAPYLRRIDGARVYSNWGPLLDELHQRLAHYFGVAADQVAVLANGTLALQGAIETVGRAGDTWTVPSWTFAASGHAVLAARRRMKLVDVDASTWAARLELTPTADGAMVVAPFGDRPAVESWADMPGPVVFDAASCFDACRGIGPALGPRQALMVSLHATKTLAAGEGGVLVGPAAWVQEVVAWANFGFYHDRVVRAAGTNAKASEYHAAVALASLDQWDLTRRAWAEVIGRVLAATRSLPVHPQPALTAGWVTPTWICLTADAAVKRRIEQECERRGVGYRSWWGEGLARMPHFAAYASGALPVTESLASRTIGLPLYIDMPDADLHRVVAALAAAT